MHGHQFHVLKIGYPPFDSITGNSTGFNPDIRCLNEDCSRGTWADPTWINGPIPGVNLVDPPLKDVVNIPANGYVIIRFMADNPGIFMLNPSPCLIDINLIFILTLTTIEPLKIAFLH